MLTLFYLCSLTVVSAAHADYYTAAVYEHREYFLPSSPTTSRKQALYIMTKNLDVLETQVALAKAQVRLHLFKLYLSFILIMTHKL